MTENADAAASMNSDASLQIEDITPSEIESGPGALDVMSATLTCERQEPSAAIDAPAPADAPPALDVLPAQHSGPSALDSQDHAQCAKRRHPATYPMERRRRRRALISAPVRVRSLHVTLDSMDEVSTTLDVSREGIFVSTQLCSYRPGMDVAVIFPYSDHAGAQQVEQVGRVVRIDEMGDGRRAVAITYAKPQQPEDEPLFDSSGRKIGTTGQMRAISQDGRSQRPVILAVDSDPRSREALSNFLSGEGYDAFVVPSGEEARAILEMHTPALLIAEAEAKGGHGYDLCAFVKSSFRLRHIPVVMTTTSAYPTDYANAHALGATICMAKPYKQERLAHVVRLLAPPKAALQDIQAVSRSPQAHALKRRGPAPALEQKIRLPRFPKF
jgi:CheY-like chemotaxis protein